MNNLKGKRGASQLASWEHIGRSEGNEHVDSTRMENVAFGFNRKARYELAASYIAA
jgi:hypothetical protein